jgi:two-component system, sensor histidine kinase and response regulator
MSLHDLPIKRKLTLLIMAVSGASLLLLSAGMLAAERHLSRKELLVVVGTRVQIVGAYCAGALAFNSEADATESLSFLRLDSAILRAALYDRHGRLFARHPAQAPVGAFPARPEPDTMEFKGSHLVVFAPVVQRGTRLGTIHLELALTALEQRSRWILWNVAAACGLAALMALGLARRFQKPITRPILALAEAAQAVTERGDYSVRAARVGRRGRWRCVHVRGDYPVRATGARRDELGQLVTAFNDMLAQIQARDAALQAAREILEDRVAERTSALSRSESRFRSVTEAAGDAIIVWDGTGQIIAWNPAATRTFGYAPDEALKLPPVGLLAEVSRLEFQRLLDRFASPGSEEVVAPPLELTGQRKDGTLFPLELACSSWRLEATVHFSGIIRDLTERKQAELVLEGARRKFELILCSVSDGVHGLDESGRITFENPAAEQMLGWPRGELIGRPAHITMHHSRPDGSPYPQTACPIHTTLRDGVSRRVDDEVFWRKDGTSFPVEYTTAPMRNEAGAVVGAVVAFRDITARKRLQAELIQARDAALASARAKAAFLANMSHEIRTPMNGVLGMTGLLLDTALTGPQRHYAQVIRASAEALLTVLNDILDFSRIEAGKLAFECLDFNLRDVVEDTLELLAESAQAKGLELTVEFDSGAPLRLRGDPGRLRQILSNLVSNAVKFTPAGEIAVTVACLAETDTEVRLRFAVRDTGIGIPPEAQARLFEPFSQADASTTRKFGGTGLGLAISKQLVAMMDGEIAVESQPGRGSRFWFSVRLEKQAGPPRAESPAAADLVPARVLVVDDNATNREILHHQLTRWDLRSGSAADGEAALAALRGAAAAGDPFHLALLDMQMPNVDGLALARRIKSEPAIAATRLILLTSLGTPLDPAALAEAGVAACLNKPARQSRLLDCLLDVIGPAAAPSAPAVADQPPFVSPSPLRARVLLAEDHSVNQMVALGLLHKLGVTADLAVNGAEVIEAVERAAYDIILMDCHMPEMDGYEATRRIRARERELACPRPVHIIAMTANAMAGDREKCLAAGMNDYLAKPVKFEEFAAVLARWQAGAGELAGSPRPLPDERTPARPPGLEAEVDPAALRRLRELAAATDPALFDKVVAAFLQDAAARLTALRQAVAAGDLAGLRAEAHSLKGAALNVGARAMAGLCLKLEHLDNPTLAANGASLMADLAASLTAARAQLQLEISPDHENPNRGR